MPTLLFGSLIVSFHNVWSGIPLLLTLYGWALVLKAAVYLVAPKLGLTALNRITPERVRIFIVPGIFMLVLAALIAFHLAGGIGA
jgi:hypothetical protein